MAPPPPVTRVFAEGTVLGAGTGDSSVMQTSTGGSGEGESLATDGKVGAKQTVPIRVGSSQLDLFVQGDLRYLHLNDARNPQFFRPFQLTRSPGQENVEPTFSFGMDLNLKFERKQVQTEAATNEGQINSGVKGAKATVNLGTISITGGYRGSVIAKLDTIPNEVEIPVSGEQAFNSEWVGRAALKVPVGEHLRLEGYGAGGTEGEDLPSGYQWAATTRLAFKSVEVAVATSGTHADQPIDTDLASVYGKGGSVDHFPRVHGVIKFKRTSGDLLRLYAGWNLREDHFLDAEGETQFERNTAYGAVGIPVGQKGTTVGAAYAHQTLDRTYHDGLSGVPLHAQTNIVAVQLLFPIAKNTTGEELTATFASFYQWGDASETPEPNGRIQDAGVVGKLAFKADWDKKWW